MIPILILAAGQSARMRGRDKLAEPVGGVPLLRRQAAMAAEVGDVCVALPRADHPRAALLDGLPVTPLIVPDAGEGMSATLRSGVAHLPPCPAFMVLLADLPLIGADHLRAILAARDAAPDALIWRGATKDGRPGHPILFDAALRPAFADLEGDAGGAEIVKRHKDKTHLCPLPGDAAVLDLDTPEEWQRFHAETGL